MALDIPVVARAAAAVPETLGGGGLLVPAWEPTRVAGLIRRIRTDEAFRTEVLAGQRAAVARFSHAEASVRLAPHGAELPLRSRSVDVFFAGDALDRVEDTERLLDELHRVLRADGLLVATASNARGYLFARTGLRHAVSPERPALMSHDEL